MNAKFKPLMMLMRRHPTIIVCSVLICSLTLFFCLRAGTVTDYQAKLEDKSKLMRKLSATIKNANDLEKHTEVLSQINKAVDAAALREGELAANQQIFLRLEDETGIKIVDLRPQGIAEASTGSSYVFMNFALSVSGDYRKIIIFLKRLESGATLSRLVNVSFNPGEADSQTVSLSVDLLGLKR